MSNFTALRYISTLIQPPSDLSESQEYTQMSGFLNNAVAEKRPDIIATCSAIAENIVRPTTIFTCPPPTLTAENIHNMNCFIQASDIHRSTSSTSSTDSASNFCGLTPPAATTTTANTPIASSSQGRININNTYASSSTSAKCGVCGSQHHGTHFGILSCRACASFFRRTVTERKTYKCRKRNNCDILKDGMRNACRACRLRRCLQAGMSANIDVDANASISIPKSSAKPVTFSNIVENPQTNIVFDLTLPTPVLDNYIGGLHNFISGQRSLFTMEHPESIFSTSQHRIESQNEFLRLERGSVTLLSTLFYTYFPSIHTISHAERVELLKIFSPLFFHLYRCHMTVLAYPDQEPIDKVVTHSTCYVDREAIRDNFFRDLPDSEEHVRFLYEMMDRGIETMVKFKALRITELEVVALMMYIFANSAEACKISISNLFDVRDIILQELNLDCMKRFGHEAPIRLGRLFAFAQECLLTVNDFKDSMTVAKIFLTHIPDIWEETINVASVPQTS